MKVNSLYTDVVLFFFSFFSKTSASLRERAWSARKKSKERPWTSLGKKRFIKSLPYVSALSLSSPRSQYQLNWTNGIGDINCLCNWLFHNETTMTLGVAHVFLDPPYTASTPKKRLKEVRSRKKSAHRMIVGFVGALYTSIVLCNHPVKLTDQRPAPELDLLL